jgi:hypothetical protein
MRLFLKLLAIVIFGPIIVGVLLILGVVAIVAVPLVWEELMARLAGPPAQANPPATGDATSDMPPTV